MTSKAARFITQLMAEIAQRDARIAALLGDVDEWQRVAEQRAQKIFRLSRDYDEACKDAVRVASELRALKAQQPSGVVDDRTAFERHWYAQHYTALNSTEAQRHFNAGIRHARLNSTATGAGVVDERAAELARHLRCAHDFIENTDAFGAAAANGVLECGGAIWDIDASKASLGQLQALTSQQYGGVVHALMSALESVVHDERVPNAVSQECAAVLIEARRLNPCRAQAVQSEQGGMKEIGVINERDDGVFVDLHDDQSFKLGQKVYAAAPFAKKES